MKPILFFLVLAFIGPALLSQTITGVSSEWNDSFKEWTIHTDVEGEEGELRLRWASQDNWREWTYRIGEWTGQIRAKWPNRMDEWEVRGENIIVTGRAMWRDDPRQWRISGPEGRQYKWSSRYGNTMDEWLIDSEKYGFMEMYTTYTNDPRDWIVVDELEGSLPERMLLVFIAVFNSTPRM